MRTLLMAAVVAFCLAGPARADHHVPPSPLDPIEDTAVGIAAFAATAVYSPVKIAANVAFMTAGLPLAMLGWIDVQCLTEGDFVITTDHLRGKRPLYFTQCYAVERAKK